MISIPKEGEKDNPSNYRPISLLPLPGKLIHQRLLNYLENNSILTDRQGGFRPGFSTTLTSASFVMDILYAQNEGKSMVAIFVDLRKCMHMVYVILN